MTDNPRQNVTFPSNGSQAHGYLATPASGSGPGVIVIQEWWGLTDHIADVTDRLAAEGFVTLAFDASHQGASGGELRFLDDPMRRIGHFFSAADYLTTLAYVDADRIGARHLRRQRDRGYQQRGRHDTRDDRPDEHGPGEQHVVLLGQHGRQHGEPGRSREHRVEVRTGHELARDERGDGGHGRAQPRQPHP